MRIRRRNIFGFYFVAFAVYIFLLWYSVDFCFFGDNVQQIAIEAHWIYGDGSTSLLRPLPEASEPYPCSGYQMPTIGFTTAILWHLFGCKLWVSHAFVFLWAIVFIISTKYIVDAVFDSKYSNLVGWMIIFQPCIVSQFMLASSDFILLASFVLAFYAIGDRKPWIFCFALLALCVVSLRGIFMAMCMVLPAIYYMAASRNGSYSAACKTIFRMCLPAIVVSVVYYTYYLLIRDFPNVSKVNLPDSLSSIFLHIKSLFVNVIGNGRFVLWIFTILIITCAIWRRTRQTIFEKSLIFFTQQTLLIYISLALFTNVVFAERFFMPITIALSFFVISYVLRWLEHRLAHLVIAIIFVSELLGYIVIDNDGSQQWDSTPSHTGYYEVREKVLNYVEQHQIKGSDVWAGRGFDVDPAIVSLEPNRPFLCGNSSSKYMLYSNVSNPSDKMRQEISCGIWIKQCYFINGAVYAVLFKRKDVALE